jgi:hypothetical protein
MMGWLVEGVSVAVCDDEVLAVGGRCNCIRTVVWVSVVPQGVSVFICVWCEYAFKIVWRVRAICC